MAAGSCATSYLIVVGDSMPPVKAAVFGPGSGILDAREFWIMAALVVVVPLAFLRRGRITRSKKRRAVPLSSH